MGSGTRIEEPLAHSLLWPLAPNQCDLNCLAVGHTFYHSFGRVLDGTPCSQGGQGLCVAGRCLVRTRQTPPPPTGPCRRPPPFSPLSTCRAFTGPCPFIVSTRSFSIWSPSFYSQAPVFQLPSTALFPQPHALRPGPRIAKPHPQPLPSRPYPQSQFPLVPKSLHLPKPRP